MTLKEFGLLIISILASGVGQLFLKMGALKLGKVTASNSVNHIFSILTTPELLAGLSLYGVGAISYILLLTRVKLSVAAPSASLIYIISVLAGYFVFKESIPTYRLFGLSFIVFGVILVVGKQ